MATGENYKLTGDYKMKITIQDTTSGVSEVRFLKTQDVYGNVLVMRGWA